MELRTETNEYYSFEKDVKPYLCEQMGIPTDEFRLNVNYWHCWLGLYEDCVRNDSIEVHYFDKDSRNIYYSLIMKNALTDENTKKFLNAVDKMFETYGDEYGSLNIKYSW